MPEDDEDDGKPLPLQRTTSSAWHAPASRSRSAWHAAGHDALVACRHGGSGLIWPFATEMPVRAVVWLY